MHNWKKKERKQTDCLQDMRLGYTSQSLSYILTVNNWNLKLEKQ